MEFKRRKNKQFKDNESPNDSDDQSQEEDVKSGNLSPDSPTK